MPIADLCEQSFSRNSRTRGHEYFASHQVRLNEVGDDFVTANVTGSRHKPYVVEVDWSDLDQQVVYANCTCPHYQEGHLCKHIWATLNQIDEDELFKSNGLEFADVLHLDEDNGEVDTWLEDDWEEDVRRSLPVPSRSMDLRERSEKRRRLANWLGQLEQIGGHCERALEDSSYQRSGTTSRPREVWYVLDVTASLQTGALTVALRQREMTKQGTLGKMKKLSVGRGDLSAITRDDDRQLVAMLLGNTTVRDMGWSYYGHNFEYRQAVTTIELSAAMHEVLLPRLAATGRFIWLLDASLPGDDGRPIAWDAGPAWRLRLRAEDDKANKCCRFSGELVRDGEGMRLDDAVLLLANGIVLFPDSLARLDTSVSEFGWIAGLREYGEIVVPHSARDEFLDAFYRLPHVPEIELPDRLRVEQQRGTPRGRIVITAPESRSYYENDTLFANVRFVYGDQEFSFNEPSSGLFDRQTGRATLRDRDQEAALVDQLNQLGLSSGGPQLGYRREYDLALPEKRFVDVVTALTRQDWIVESEGVRIRRPGTFSFGVTSGVEWFELSGQIDFDGVTASLPDLLRAVRNRDRYVRLDDGSQGMLPEEWLKKFAGFADVADEAGDTLRFALSQALLLDAMLAEQDNVAVDRQFGRFRDKLHGFEGVKPADPPRGFHGKLRQYQREGLGWLHFLREFRLGGCLADDMGLGKTVQVLALLQSRRLSRPAKGATRRPSIVVVPKSLVFNWIDEARRFTPNLRVVNYTGTDRKSRLAESDGYDLLVTTYGTLRRDVADLREVEFDYAILDESQAIKNHASQASKACRLLTAEHRLAMTGTPVENHLGDLWSLFEFLNPGMLGRSVTFASLTGGNTRDDGQTALLARALRPFMLRRTKEQVLTELPQKTEQTLYCEMSAKQRKNYDRLRDYYRAHLSGRVKEVGLKRAKIHVLEALLRLRQAACHPGLLDGARRSESSPKLAALVEQLQEVTAEGHKALVFSQFTSLLAIVREALDGEGMTYEYLDGRTRKRAERVKRFQNDANCPLFLISLKAGGHGLNLTAADYVFILDPWWNPAVEAQAIDRAHRIGQTRSVFAYRLICRDTIEDKIVELQKSKRELADAIVSADNSLIRSLTAEDLTLLLS